MNSALAPAAGVSLPKKIPRERAALHSLVLCRRTTVEAPGFNPAKKHPGKTGLQARPKLRAKRHDQLAFSAASRRTAEEPALLAVEGTCVLTVNPRTSSPK
jgi:hypothetical protein